jgi:uncharacterized protein YodC (DUF2158 family)
MATSAHLKSGKVVRLKSGGPPMVITREPSDEYPGTVGCIWFVGADLRRDAFPIDGVETVDPPEVP